MSEESLLSGLFDGEFAAGDVDAALAAAADPRVAAQWTRWALVRHVLRGGRVGQPRLLLSSAQLGALEQDTAAALTAAGAVAALATRSGSA